MAEIPRDSLNRFVEDRMGLTTACKELARSILDSYTGDPNDLAALFNHCYSALDEICLAATETAAVLEGEFYQLVYELSNGEAFDPVFDSGYNPQSVEKSLHAFITDYSSNMDMAALSGKMAQRVGMEIDHAIARCATENGKRDKKPKKWARVPSSPMPCDYCLMLASRGFVYSSYESARGKVGSHYGECKCTIMQGYNGMTVSGYDTDELRDRWKHPEKYEEEAGESMTLRQRLEAEARDVYIRNGGGMGLTPEQAAERFDLLVDGNTNAQLRQYIKKHGGGRVAARAVNGTNPILSINSKQFGAKMGEHVEDFGFALSDLGNENVRKELADTFHAIIESRDEVLETPWRGQDGVCKAYVKGGYVVLVDHDGGFVTAFKEVEGGSKKLNEARAALSSS